MLVVKLLRRRREGLSVWSQLLARLGSDSRPPRFAGVLLSAPDSSAAWGVTKEIADGEYDHAEFAPTPGDRVIDVGANIGVFALWAARRGATVTAYEPAPLTYEHLTRNVASEPKIAIVNAAVVGRVPDAGSVPLYLHSERSTRNTLLAREVESGEPIGQRVDVPAVSIGEVLAQGCDLLKLDCEGAEFDIFRSADPVELQSVTRILVEFHRLAGEPEELLRILTASGFSARILGPYEEHASFGIIGGRRVAAHRA